tara:strand:+ start:4349 stop:7348 length:3000 start_codon:yes stop_codon:yes gene_type:complete
MIYEIETPDGRIIEVEGEPGQEELAVKKVKEYLAKEAGGKIYNESQFDYQTGIGDLALRAQLDTAETKEEKERVLSRYVGSRNFIYDSNGRLAVTPDGQRRLGLEPTDKNIVVDEEGMSIADFADFAGTVGPIAGAIAALNPYGRVISKLKPLLKNDRVVRTAATGLGSAGGKGAEEAFELLNNTQLQDSSEIASELLEEGTIGAASQGIFELGGYGLYALLGRKAPIIDVDIARAIAQGADPDEVAQLSQRLGRTASFEDVKKAQEAGQIQTFTQAAVSQRALGRSIPGRIQAASETVFGRTERDAELLKYGNQRLKRMLEKQGDISASLDDFAQATKTGRATQREVEEIINKINVDRDLSQQALDDLINNAVKMIDNGALTNNPDRVRVGQALRDQIRKAYDAKFGQYTDTEGNQIVGTFVEEAQKIDAYITDNGLGAINGSIKLKTDALVDKIDDLIKVNPGLELYQAVEGVAGGKIGVIQNILKKVKNEGMSIEGLSNLRSAILAVQRGAGSEARQVTRLLKVVADDIDDIFKNLSEGMSVTSFAKGTLTKEQEKALIKATKDIRDYNQRYRKAIRPFDNTIVAKIRKDASSDAYDIDEIYKHVLKKDRPQVLTRVLQAIPDQAGRAEAKSELQRNFVREALDSPNVRLDTGEVNPVAFANYFKRNLGSTQKVLFDNIPDLDRMLSDFAKINRKVDAKRLDKIVSRIEMKDLSKAVDDLVKNENLLHQAEADRLFRRIESAEPDEIVNILFRNGQASNITRMKGKLNAETFQNIQQDSMRDLLRVAQGPGKTIDEVFKPDALERALNAKGDDTLRAMFDDETVKSLRNLVRDLRVMTASEGGGAGTLIAGAVAVNAFNIAMLPQLANLYIVGSILRRPNVVARLAKSDSESINIVMRAFKDAIRLTPPVLLGQELYDLGEEVSDFTEQTIEDADIDFDFGEATQQIREGIREIPRPPQVSLDLPEVQSVPTARVARRGPTLLPNPRDQEIAELLG